MRERCLFPSLLFRYSGAAAMINIEKAITTTKTANHSGAARYVIPGSGNREARIGFSRPSSSILLFIQYIEAEIGKSEMSIGIPAPYSNLLSAILLYNITRGKARGKIEIYFLFLTHSS